MSVGLVVLEKKLFTRTRTPQSDDIKKPINLILKLQVIYSLSKWQSSYYSVSFGAIALKIYDTDHQKVAKQHI